MLKRLIWLGIFCIFSLSILAQGEVTFIAQANARQVTEGSYFQVEFILSNADWTRFTPPDFRGFQQHGNPSQSMQTSIFNGQRTMTKSLTYNVLAKKTGKFVIRPAEAIVNGKAIKSNSVAIEVVKGKPKSSQGETDSNNFFVRTELSTEEARIGQQVTLDYKLYTKVNIESFDLGQEPEYKGFYAENLRRFNYRVMREVIDGETYNTKILKRVALYPQQAGLLTVEPMTLRLGVAKPGNRRRSFFFNEIEYIPFITDSVQVNVFPLPGEIPEDFSGAVGRYAMAAAIDKSVLSTDDALTITMTLRGDGDIKRVTSPDLNLDENFEQFDPNILEEKVFESNGEIVGRKVIEYKVVPKVAGNFMIQPTFTYFDTDSLKFIKLGIDATPITVKQGRKKYSSSIVKEPPVEQQATFLPIQKTTSLHPKGQDFFGSGWFWGLAIFPFLLLGAAVVYRQMLLRQGDLDLDLLKSQRAQKVAKKKLSQAEQFMQANDSQSFYDEISRASFGYVCDKLQIPLAELSKANVQEKLHSLSVSQQYIDDFLKIIKTCEMALFAGMDNSAAMQETYQNASEVIVKIEEEIHEI